MLQLRERRLVLQDCLQRGLQSVDASGVYVDAELGVVQAGGPGIVVLPEEGDGDATRQQTLQARQTHSGKGIEGLGFRICTQLRSLINDTAAGTASLAVNGVPQSSGYYGRGRQQKKISY